MKLRAGTRKSPLAMTQTYMVLDMIKTTFPECDTEIVPTRANSRYLQTFAQRNRQVLCTVYCKVYLSALQSLFYLRDEHTLAAYLVKRSVKLSVALVGTIVICL